MVCANQNSQKILHQIIEKVLTKMINKNYVNIQEKDIHDLENNRESNNY